MSEGEPSTLIPEDADLDTGDDEARQGLEEVDEKNDMKAALPGLLTDLQTALPKTLPEQPRAKTSAGESRITSQQPKPDIRAHLASIMISSELEQKVRFPRPPKLRGQDPQMHPSRVQSKQPRHWEACMPQ